MEVTFSYTKERSYFHLGYFDEGLKCIFLISQKEDDHF